MVLTFHVGAVVENANIYSGTVTESEIPNPASLLSIGTSRRSLVDASERMDSYADATLDALAKDLKVEGRLLKEAIDGGRLELRWEGLVKSVSDAVKAEYENNGARDLQLRQQRNLVEENLRSSAKDQGVVEG